MIRRVGKNKTKNNYINKKGTKKQHRAKENYLVLETYRIYSNKRRPRISAASGSKRLISAATPMRRLFEEFRITRKNTINEKGVRSHR